MNIKKILASLDYWLIGAVCILCIFGIICIGSATRINLGESRAVFDAQIRWFIVGIGLMLIVVLVNYRFFAKFYLLLYLFNIGLLVAVLLI